MSEIELESLQFETTEGAQVFDMEGGEKLSAAEQVWRDELLSRVNREFRNLVKEELSVERRFQPSAQGQKGVPQTGTTTIYERNVKTTGLELLPLSLKSVCRQTRVRRGRTEEAEKELFSEYTYKRDADTYVVFNNKLVFDQDVEKSLNSQSPAISAVLIALFPLEYGASIVSQSRYAFVNNVLLKANMTGNIEELEERLGINILVLFDNVHTPRQSPCNNIGKQISVTETENRIFVPKPRIAGAPWIYLYTDGHEHYFPIARTSPNTALYNYQFLFDDDDKTYRFDRGREYTEEVLGGRAFDRAILQNVKAQVQNKVRVPIDDSILYQSDSGVLPGFLELRFPFLRVVKTSEDNKTQITTVVALEQPYYETPKTPVGPSVTTTASQTTPRNETFTQEKLSELILNNLLVQVAKRLPNVVRQFIKPEERPKKTRLTEQEQRNIDLLNARLAGVSPTDISLDAVGPTEGPSVETGMPTLGPDGQTSVVSPPRTPSSLALNELSETTQNVELYLNLLFQAFKDAGPSDAAAAATPVEPIRPETPFSFGVASDMEPIERPTSISPLGPRVESPQRPNLDTNLRNLVTQGLLNVYQSITRQT